MPEFSYDAVGTTRPDEELWLTRPNRYRCFERTVCISHEPARWDSITVAVLGWQIKIRSGFTVSAASGGAEARAGTQYELTARVGPLTVREPIRVITVVDRPDRCGFSYGTLHGHPVSGEEAFVAHRSADGKVWLTIRSLTRPSTGPWRWTFPLLLVAQHVYRRRYFRALLHGPAYSPP